MCFKKGVHELVLNKINFPSFFPNLVPITSHRFTFAYEHHGYFVVKEIAQFNP